MRFHLVLLTTGLIAFSGVAFAQGWHGDHRAETLFSGANLSDAQKTQIKTIEDAGRAQAKPVMEQIHTVHEQIMSRMLGAGSVSEADLAPLVSQEEALRNQIDQIKLSRGLEMRAVLSASQLSDAAAKHAQLVSLHEQERAVVDPQ